MGLPVPPRVGIGILRPVTVTDVFRETDEPTREPGANPGDPTSTRRAPPSATVAVFSRARRRFDPYDSELDIEFVYLVGLLAGGCNPRRHLFEFQPAEFRQQPSAQRHEE